VPDALEIVACVPELFDLKVTWAVAVPDKEKLVNVVVAPACNQMVVGEVADDVRSARA
jgi:hypothetical protein